MLYVLAPHNFFSFTSTVVTIGYSKKINLSYLSSQNVFIVQMSSYKEGPHSP